MENRVEKGKNATFEASDAFKDIARSSGETLRTSQDILTATEVQKSSIANVVQYVQEVVAIAEQTASGTQQVAATAQQLSTSMQELTNSSLALNEIAEDLQAGIAAFKLLESPVNSVMQPAKKKTHPRKTGRESSETVSLSPIVKKELKQGVNYVKEKMKLANEEQQQQQVIRTESNGRANGKK
jgi:hypothetical protein